MTRTYTAPGCSINAWIKSKEAAVVSMKMKAHMLGELGEDLSWQDMLNDGGLSHYKAKDDEGMEAGGVPAGAAGVAAQAKLAEKEIAV